MSLGIVKFDSESIQRIDDTKQFSPVNEEADAEPADHDELIWNDDDPPGLNYQRLGERLAESIDLYASPEYGSGLVMVLPDGKTIRISKGADLAPVIVDRVRVRILKDGKPKGGQIAASHLNAMLKSSSFLSYFTVAHHIASEPIVLSDFSVAVVGLNKSFDGTNVLYAGEPAEASESMECTNLFLNEMAFATEADRTNTVAALLTTTLRQHWPGGKPILVVTASKSHAGKDTVISFAAGSTKQCSISYQATNWALERSFIGAVNHDPDTGVVVIENARLDRRDRFLASAFVERFATDPEPLLFSTGTGKPARRRNDIVLAISTNFGSVSEDIMNRALPIHLNPVGNVADRHSSIGNPKLEFLPKFRHQIAAEARGMIQRWKAAGQPLDKNVNHPFSVWAQTIGGILDVSGFSKFLANYGQRRTSDDPLREALGILGGAHHDEWKRPQDWADLIANLGLTKRLIPTGDQDTPAGRRRGTGVVLSAHQDETFLIETESTLLELRLAKCRKRLNGEPCVHYRFNVLKRTPIEHDEPVTDTS